MLVQPGLLPCVGSGSMPLHSCSLEGEDRGPPAWRMTCSAVTWLCAAGDSYKATPTEVTPTVVLPPTPPASAAKKESDTHSPKAGSDAPAGGAAAQAKAQAPAAAAAPQPAADSAAEALISDYGFSKNLAPVAVEEYTGKYRCALQHSRNTTNRKTVARA